MELLIGLVFIGALIFTINTIVETQRQTARDRAAREVLGNFDINGEKQETEGIHKTAQETLKNVGANGEKQGMEKNYEDFFKKISLSRCPQCKSDFVIKQNLNEIIWACCKYPECSYVKGRIPNGIL